MLARPFFFCSTPDMSHGQYGFDHHKARAANRRHHALATVGCWRMGRRHLTDDIDHALAVAVRENSPGQGGVSKATRRQAVASLQAWLKTSPHLPPDLVRAVHDLLPEVGQGSMVDDWPIGQQEWPD